MDDSTLKIKIDGDTSGFKNKLKNISSKAEKLFGDVGKGLTSTGKKFTKGVTIPIVETATASVKMAKDFDSSLMKVSTISDMSVVSIEQLGEVTKRISKEMGINASDLNEALYQTLSATNDIGNAMMYLEQGAKLAIGGFTDTTTAIDGATSVMNAYGIKGSDAFKKISDDMIMTQNLGKTTVGELADAFYNVIPTAASLGVSFDEVSAAIAAITAQGIPASVATTNLRQMFVELSNDSSKTSKIFEKLAGKDFTDFVAAGGTVADALKLLEEEAVRNDLSLNDMFGSLEAGYAALQLTSSGAEKFSEALAAMQLSTGATETAFTTMGESSSMQFEKLQATLSIAAIEIGEKLLPVILEVVEKIESLVEWFSNLDEETQNNIIKWVLIAAAIGPVLMLIGNIATGISALISLFTNISIIIGFVSQAFAFLCSPAGMVVLAIAAIIAMGVLLWQNWDTIKEYAINIWNGIKDFFVSIWSFLRSLADFIWNGIKDTISGVWNSLKDLALIIWDGIKNIVSSTWNSIWDFTVIVWNSIKNTLLNIWDCIKNLVLQTWLNIKNFIFAGWIDIKQVTENVWNGVNNFLQNIWDCIKSLVWGTWDWIKNLIDNAWNNIKDTAVNVWNNIKDFLNNTWNNISDNVKNIWNSIKNFFVDTWNNLKDSAWKGIKNIGDTIWNAFQGIISGVWDLGKQIVTGIWDGINSGASWLWDKLGGFFGGIIQKGKEILGIHSPSKEFAYLGQMSAIGYDEAMEKGMKDAKKHVEKDLNGLLQTAKIKAKAVLGMSVPSSVNAEMRGATTNYITNDKGVTQNFYSQTTSPYDAYRRAVLNAY